MPQRIAVLGTGAQGAGIGADLVRAGHDVTFIEQWPAHVETMRTDGIRVVLPDEETITPVAALHICEVATLRQPFDIVFTLVKAYDTRWSVELIKPYVADDGVVVGLQNGMSIDDIAAVVGSHRTIGAVIEMASNMYVPGTVNRQTTRARSWFAVGGMDATSQAKAPAVAAVLRAAGRVEVTEDIRSAKWMKLVVNAGELVPSAIVDLPLAEAIRLPGMHAFMLECCREAVHAAVDDGNRMVPIFGLDTMDLADPDRFVEQLLDAVLRDFSMPDTRTTVLQDWDKGRHSEVEEVNGLVVDVRSRLGGTAPANAITVELARQIETGTLKAGVELAERLVGSLVR